MNTHSIMSWLRYDARSMATSVVERLRKLSSVMIIGGAVASICSLLAVTIGAPTMGQHLTSANVAAYGHVFIGGIIVLLLGCLLEANGRRARLTMSACLAVMGLLELFWLIAA